MLSGLQTEINNWPELGGASNKIIMTTLNAPGSAQVEEWIRFAFKR